MTRIADEGQLYGPAATLTLRNVLSWETPALFLTELLGKTKRVKEGYEIFWNRLISQHPYNIFYHSKITCCIPQAQSVLLLPVQKEYRHVFVTVPLDEIDTPLTPLLDSLAPFNSAYILSTYVKIPRGLWKFKEESVYTFDHPQFKTITSVSTYPKFSHFKRKQEEDFDVIWFLSRLKATDSLTDALIQNRLQELSTLTDVSPSVMEVIFTRIFRYNIHYSPQQLLSDLPSKIDDLQGKEGIWYSGGSLSHWNVAAITDFNLRLLRRFFWRNESSKIKAIVKGLSLGAFFPLIQGGRYR